MKKLFLFILTISMSICLTSCLKISTPEDMLAIPELDKEQKDMKDAVDSFRPINSTVYPVYFSETKKRVNMILSDLDSDSSNELISFYKNASDDKIGMFILKKQNLLWIKLYEVIFDSYELGNISVADLDGRGTKEILIEYYNNSDNVNTKNLNIAYIDGTNIKLKKDDSYIVMKTADINKNGKKQIFYIYKDSSNYPNFKLNIDEFNNKNIINKKQVDLGKIETPYDINIGTLFDDVMAVFIDYNNDSKYENTKVLMYNRKTDEFVNIHDLIKGKYVFNVPSADIDNDGVIEVAYKFKSPNYTVSLQDNNDLSMIDGYFKIKNDYTLEFVKELYENKSFGYVINFPLSFKGKYTLYTSDDSTDININYLTNQGKEYLLAKLNYIKKFDWQKDSKMREDMQIIKEDQNYVIAGQVFDFSENLEDTEKETYLKMRSDILVLSNIIKEKN